MLDPENAPLVPARIVNEHVYCPRLAWLEWEARAFVDNLETAEGTDAHRRVDVVRGRLDDPETPGDAQAITALALGSERLGVTAKLDRVELRDGVAIPVETKRGRPRTRGAQPVWDPELAQITVQVLLLREAGYETPHAEVYFTESRTRHDVSIPTDAEDWIARLVLEIPPRQRREPHPRRSSTVPSARDARLSASAFLTKRTVCAAPSQQGPPRAVSSPATTPGRRST